MGLLSWLRSRGDGGAERTGGERARETAAPSPEPVAASREDRFDIPELPPLQRTLTPPTLVSDPLAFEAALPTRQPTAFTTPLGHAVSTDAPSGIVHGVTTPVPGPAVRPAESARHEAAPQAVVQQTGASQPAVRTPRQPVAQRAEAEPPVRGLVGEHAPPVEPPAPMPVQRAETGLPPQRGARAETTPEVRAEAEVRPEVDPPVRGLVGEHEPLVESPAPPSPNPGADPLPPVQRAASERSAEVAPDVRADVPPLAGERSPLGPLPPIQRSETDAAPEPEPPVRGLVGDRAPLTEPDPSTGPLPPVQRAPLASPNPGPDPLAPVQRAETDAAPEPEPPVRGLVGDRAPLTEPGPSAHPLPPVQRAPLTEPDPSTDPLPPVQRAPLAPPNPGPDPLPPVQRAETDAAPETEPPVRGLVGERAPLVESGPSAHPLSAVSPDPGADPLPTAQRAPLASPNPGSHPLPDVGPVRRAPGLGAPLPGLPPTARSEAPMEPDPGPIQVPMSVQRVRALPPADVEGVDVHQPTPGPVAPLLGERPLSLRTVDDSTPSAPAVQRAADSPADAPVPVRWVTAPAAPPSPSPLPVSRMPAVQRAVAPGRGPLRDAGDVAVAAGVAQRMADGSVVFAPPSAPTPSALPTPSYPSYTSIPIVQREVAAEEPPPPEPPPEPEPAPASAPAPAPSASATPTPSSSPQHPKVTDEFVRALYPPLARLLKADLRLDRERAGFLIEKR